MGGSQITFNVYVALQHTIAPTLGDFGFPALGLQMYCRKCEIIYTWRDKLPYSPQAGPHKKHTVINNLLYRGDVCTMSSLLHLLLIFQNLPRQDVNLGRFLFRPHLQLLTTLTLLLTIRFRLVFFLVVPASLYCCALRGLVGALQLL